MGITILFKCKFCNGDGTITSTSNGAEYVCPLCEGAGRTSDFAKKLLWNRFFRRFLKENPSAV